ncbi:MAG: hypothetical protein Q9172_005415 [Xanthocarpia lactea]
MKILCLHGVGSSGGICESQFRAFLKLADPSYEFVFTEGPARSEKGPGMGAYFEGPFYSHTTGYSPDEMADALDHLDMTIEELGPFDGILGFSQGAALALSYIYQQQVCGRPVPFKFFLCFSSVIPFSADAGYCQNIVQRLCALQWDMTVTPSADERLLTRDERLFCEIMLRTVIAAKKKGAALPEYSMDLYNQDDGSKAPRVMHAQLLEEKLQIPTVHVTGKRDFDFMHKMSDIAQGMCEERLTRKLMHSGGHQPPQKDAEVKSVLRAMEWAISQSERMPKHRL